MDKAKGYADVIIKYFQTAGFNSWGKIQPSTGLNPEEDHCITKYIGNRRCSVMDVGTGGGRVAIALSKAGFAPIYGFDFVPELIDVARDNAKARKLDIVFEVATACAIPLPDTSVEIAIYWGTIFGLLADPLDRKQAIREAFRVLCPGGFLFSNYLHFASRKFNGLLRLYAKIIRSMTRDKLPERSLPILRKGGKFSVKSLLPNSPQVYWHYPDEAILELTTIGFHIVEILSSIGFKKNDMVDYRNLRKGIFYIVAKKPIT